MTVATAVDALTGALSRAAFEPDWQACVDAARAGGRCALLVFDVDHFKSINDAFGHRQGDEVLQQVVQRVRACTRGSDRLYRYGGDEFVLVLPATGQAEAAELAQRALDAVAQPIGATGLVVGLSVGVAALPEDGDQAVALFELADARSYQAKRQGRARVVAHDLDSAGELPFGAAGRLVEREAALAQGQAFLDAWAAAGAGVLLVEGPAGAGRSAVLHELARRARQQGILVLGLACAAQLQARPHAALCQALPEWQPLEAAEAVGDDLPALRAALQARLQAAGARRLLLCVDDLPRLDWPSLHLLRELLATCHGPDPGWALGLVAVVDSRAAPAASLLAAPVQQRLQLLPLGEPGLRIWLRTLLQWDAPPDFVAWLAVHTGGLPRAVQALLQRLLAQGTLQRQPGGWLLDASYPRAAGGVGTAAGEVGPPHNLPLQLTSFVGREAQLQAVHLALQQHRLLTLTGTGGTGKTRLALALAADLREAFRHGVWFIDLGRVTDPEGVALAVAAVLGVRKVRSRPMLASLVAALARKAMLLVLDNCEHLVGASAALAEALLRSAPELRLLATSREPLGVPGEQLWRLPSMALPPVGRLAPPRQLLDVESVRLFVERAALARSDFRLDSGNAGAVVQLCQRLDGIPLAIELAAARLRHLPLAQLVQRLDDRFSLLTSGHRQALPRQQTLRALVDWSHDLLSGPEQVLLRRLGVFAGGCTLDSAESICGALAPLSPAEVLPLLCSLADKSLLLVQAASRSDAGPRYRLLETIRHYALDKLAAAGETVVLRSLHLQASLDLAERSEPGVCGPDQQAWLDRLDAETGNLNAALEFAQAHDAGATLRLASALWRFCDLRGHRVAGLDTLLRALQAGQRDEAHALGLARAAYMTRNLGDFAQAFEQGATAQALAKACGSARAEALAAFVQGAAALELARSQEGCALLHHALRLSQAAGDDGLAGTALVFLGFEAEMRNDVAAARHWMQQGLAAARRCGDRRRICHALVRLGFVAIASSDAGQAVRCFEEALALGRAIGDLAYVVNGLYLLGRAALFVGDFDRARQLLNEVTTPREGAIASEISWGQVELARVCWAEGDFDGMAAALDQALALTAQGGLDEAQATALVLAGHVARVRGRPAEARALAAQALTVFQRSRREGLCLCVELWALLALDAGQPEAAARWLGAREALRERLFALDHYPFLLQRRSEVVAQLRQALGADGLAQTWQDGRALAATDQAVWALGAAR